MENGRAGGENNMISITILTLDAQRYSLCVPKQILVGHLKEEISRLTGIPMERQGLLFHGQRLLDDESLSQCHLQDGDTLHLVTRQPNTPSSSHVLDPPAPVSEDHTPFDIHIHGHGSVNYTNQVLSAIVSGLVRNLTNDPEFQPEDPSVMMSLRVQLNDLRRRSSREDGGGIQVATAPSEQPLLRLLQLTSSLLNNMYLTVYIIRLLIARQRSDSDLFEQRLVYNARILRDQLWLSSPFLGQLGNVMNDLVRQPSPNMPQPPPPASSVPSQPERRTSRRRMNNNGASSSNSNNNAAAGTSSQDPNASENFEDRNRRALPRPRNPRASRRRRGNDM